MDFETYPGLKDAFEKTGFMGEADPLVPKNIKQVFIDLLPENGKVLAVAGTSVCWWFLTEDSIIMGLKLFRMKSERVPIRTITGIELRKKVTKWVLTLSRANNIDELSLLDTEKVGRQFADAVNDQIASLQSNNGSSKNESSLDKIKKLKELLEAGAITKEEFEEKKSKLLSEI